MAAAHPIVASRSSKVLSANIAAAATIAAADAFAAAADLSDGNLGPDTNHPGPRGPRGALGALGGPGGPRGALGGPESKIYG